MSDIIVRGAREHNLKNLDVTIPRDQLVVVTGLSGSGKSSLAFDTIYAEGQRRYVESLSAYARQFLDQNEKPDVDHIAGLSPAISIEQKSTSRNPRSTVGTLTEIYDYLRLLYARIGRPHCYECGKTISAATVQDIVDGILRLPTGTKFMVMAPIVRGRKGEYRRDLDLLRKEGFVRIRVDGAMRDLGEDIRLDKKKKHDLDLVVDRLAIKPGLKQRLTDSVELALKKAEGVVAIAVMEGDDTFSPDKIYSERFACHDCDVSYPELEPRLFSFNSPHGACPACDGLGAAMEMDAERVIPDVDKSLAGGAIQPWTGRFSSFYRGQLRGLCAHYQQSMDTPWKKLPKRFRTIVLCGSGKTEISYRFEKEDSVFAFTKAFEGVMPQLSRRLKEIQSDKGRDKLSRYMSSRPCHECQGARLRREALAVHIGGENINMVTDLSVADISDFFTRLKLNKRDEKIAGRVLREVNERLSFLLAVGLNYLSLGRTAATLSGGEAQRIRLATQIGSALRGVIYVLDEPSIGLHQRDNDRLLATLKRLRDLGNTVLVVEHDEDTIRAADHVIDIGPGAGLNGGRIVAQGTPEEVERSDSLTADYLSGRRAVAVPSERRPGNGECIKILGARGNNLKSFDVAFPLGKFICVTGVSGSGKSTLVNETLYRALARNLHDGDYLPAPHDKVTGLEHIDKVIEIDQSPIGRTPRSNPATYTGLFSVVRDLFAGLPDSRARGYKPGRYSFNVKGGRCEACEGDGILRIEMHFLPDVYVTCEQCKGLRYNRETLEILYKGKSIADVLQMSVDQAVEFLSAIPQLKRKLLTLQAVGLGYIKLGQSATTLSGGEAQRIKLSKELSKRSTGRTFYVLDEPTTGLHFYDVDRLLGVLHQLADGGNTVLVIEHNLDVIKTADHIIDLGPEGGAGGGRLLAEGSPEQITTVAASHTGRYLLPLLRPKKKAKSRRRA